MNVSTVDIAGSKARQFTIPKIDSLFDFYTPKPPLSKFVDTFWMHRGGDSKQKIERILPTGTLELAINLHENELGFSAAEGHVNSSRLSGAVVSGAHGRGFVPDPAERVLIIGVHFKPGGAFPFLGLPACELADIHVDLEGLWGARATSLRGQLCEARTDCERFRLLEEALLARLTHNFEHNYAVSTALEIFARDQTGPKVRELAKYIGLSQRRFIQLFKAEVGMTPKLFSRIQRFQRTRIRIKQNRALNWATLAADLGYFDQSHLIREFVEFSGSAPTDYVNQQRSFL